MKVLLIEDSVSMGKAMRKLLTDQGHTVQWIVGLRRIEERDGSSAACATAIDEDNQDQLVAPLQVDVAFVDGQLDGDFTGPQVVAFLAANNVPCLGISTQSDLNQEMVALGARFGLKKPVAFVGLVAGLLQPELLLDTLKGRKLNGLQRALQATKIRRLVVMESTLMTSVCERIRKQADEYFRPFLLEEFK